MEKANILLTGSAGFIGRHVARLLQQRGHEVRGVDCLVEQVHGAPPWNRPQWEWRGTVGQFAAAWARSPLERYDAVVHLAAEVGVAQSQYEIARYVDGNVGETARLWEAVVAHHSEVRKLVVASSMSVYGEGAVHLGEDTGARPFTGGFVHRSVPRGWDAFEYRWERPFKPIDVRPALTPESKIPEPASVYAQTKHDQERYSLLLGEAYQVPTVALRFFNAFGPGQSLSNPYTGVLASFACRVLNGQPPLVNEDGLQTRDFVHVSDVAHAVVLALEEHGLSGVYNVCTGVPTTVLSLAEQWCELARARGLPSVVPCVTGRYRTGDVRHCVGSYDALRRAVGWEPAIALRDGLDDVATWVLATGQHVMPPADRNATAADELRARGLMR